VDIGCQFLFFKGKPQNTHL